MHMSLSVAQTHPLMVSRAWARRSSQTVAVVWLLMGAALGCVQPFLAIYAARRGLTLAEIGLLATTSALASALLQPVVGRLLDRSGHHRALLVACACSAALGCAL